MERFEGTIEEAPGGGAYVAVPAVVVAGLGGGGRIPVQATFDGVAYAGSIASMGAGPCLGMLKAIRAELGKGPGDSVVVTVERDTAERAVEVPQDLAAALRTAGARAAFDALSFSKRREAVQGIEGAKRPDTRARRIDQVVAALR
ncbi:YdeI/OmpD-associated family protein [Nocardia sp. NPDC052566]|uniref:YdeI/OmpD-associated family protein n=1 Tax=Nocardia sp. NPDC052566 TaxID=3364330 RepID=UPI0037CC58B7